ncbi:hypothetical protein [Neptuniibacter marinus]|uniref:hypothetical protein n=1 Tax=Neptuniibacter marinus TaxID=1806670 RepID=UPI003B5A7FF5
MKLYKYIPEQFVDGFVNKGHILFRNLTYFRQYEDNRRGDLLEGFHRDNPDNDITLSCPNTGRVLAKGDFSFLNSINTDLIFVFCLSRLHKEELYEEFESNICVEITDGEEFERRARLAVMRYISLHRCGLLSGNVMYYQHTAPAGFNIKEPKNLAFAKGAHYEHQQEFRLVFGTTKRAFELKQQVVINQRYDFFDEARKGQSKEKLLKVGSLNDIAKVHRI